VKKGQNNKKKKMQDVERKRGGRGDSWSEGEKRRAGFREEGEGDDIHRIGLKGNIRG